MNARLLSLSALVVGCSLQSSGLSTLDAAADSPVNPPDSSVDDASVADGAPMDDAALDAGPAPDTGSCTPSACEGKRCVGSTCGYYGSCDELHNGMSSLPTGDYVLYSTKAKAKFDAHCEMSIEGGGWTLVGASVILGNSNSFGWKKKTGSIQNNTAPYSLGVEPYGLPVNELLLGVRGLGLDFLGGAAIYRLGAPANFMGLGNSGAAVTSSKSVAGLCGSTAAPLMLANVGQVDQNAIFFFRDQAGTSGGVYGLRADGLDLLYYATDCAHTGGLGPIQSIPPVPDIRQQGLLFVR